MGFIEDQRLTGSCSRERGTTPRAWLFVREQSRAIVIWTRFSCSYSRSKGTANTLRIAGKLLCRVLFDACKPYEVWPIDYDYESS
jgi:hypothetical protein